MKMTMTKNVLSKWLFCLLLLRNIASASSKTHLRRAKPKHHSKSYGVDISFPIHHKWFNKEKDDPRMNSQKIIYAVYMGGCREQYPEVEEMCDDYERRRIEKNLHQPASLENFTDIGYKKMQTPPELWNLIKTFWDDNDGRESYENWQRGDVFTNHWISPTYRLDFNDRQLEKGGKALVKQIQEAAKPAMEKWSNKALTPTNTYGIRIYAKGAIVSPHVDGVRKVISAIINVAQDVDEPWILELIDLKGKARNITMEPGEMLMYESRTIIHGRPYRLDGRFVANALIQFEPTIQYLKNFDEEEEEKHEEEQAEKEAKAMAQRLQEQYDAEQQEIDDDFEENQEEEEEEQEGGEYEDEPEDGQEQENHEEEEEEEQGDQEYDEEQEENQEEEEEEGGGEYEDEPEDGQEQENHEEEEEEEQGDQEYEEQEEVHEEVA